MNDNDIKNAVADRVVSLWVTVQDRIGCHMNPPRITYYDNRLAAGVARYKAHEVAFNIVLLRENFDEMLHETVAHEVAHIAHVTAQAHGALPRERRRRPHGPQWQRIMRDWFGVEPERTHALDTSNVKAKRQRRWPAECGCQTHSITTVRRNKMLRGSSYRCRGCKQSLTLVKGTFTQ